MRNRPSTGADATTGGEPETPTRFLLALSCHSTGARLSRGLRSLDVSVMAADRLADVIHQTLTDPFDGLLIDGAFAGPRSVELCARAASQTDTAIIFISDSETDRLTALLKGADDSVASDCPAGEMLARTTAVQRRIARAHASFTHRNPVRFLFDGYDYCHLSRRLIRPDGSGFSMSAAMSDTLMAFLLKPGVWLSKDRLRETVRPGGTVSDNDLRVSIYRLRKALDDNDPESPVVQNSLQLGYRLAADVTLVESSFVEPARHCPGDARIRAAA